MLNVLLVDDEKLERKFLRKILEHRKDQYYVVGEAADGRQAVELAKSLHPEIVILDINMPEQNGLEAGRIIKSISPETIVILNSAYAEFQFARQALDYDLDAYLVKPSQEQEILDMIASLIKRRAIEGIVQKHGSTEHEPDFPYHLSDGLLQGIQQKNMYQIRENAEALICKLQDNRGSLEYKLFMVNTIFSIERLLHEVGSPEEMLQLLDSKKTLQTLGESADWRVTNAVSRDYISRLMILLDGITRNQRRGASAMETIIAYIDKHYGEDIHLNDLAGIVYLSPSYVSKLFHQSLNTSLSRYLHRKRMELAKKLLNESRCSIKEISHQCGYHNLSQFYLNFREQYHVGPGAYRNQGEEG